MEVKKGKWQITRVIYIDPVTGDRKHIQLDEYENFIQDETLDKDTWYSITSPKGAKLKAEFDFVLAEMAAELAGTAAPAAPSPTPAPAPAPSSAATAQESAEEAAARWYVAFESVTWQGWQQASRDTLVFGGRVFLRKSGQCMDIGIGDQVMSFYASNDDDCWKYNVVMRIYDTIWWAIYDRYRQVNSTRPVKKDKQANFNGSHFY